MAARSPRSPLSGAHGLVAGQPGEALGQRDPRSSCTSSRSSPGQPRRPAVTLEALFSGLQSEPALPRRCVCLSGQKCRFKLAVAQGYNGRLDTTIMKACPGAVGAQATSSGLLARPPRGAWRPEPGGERQGGRRLLSPRRPHGVVAAGSPVPWGDSVREARLRATHGALAPPTKHLSPS